MFRCFITLGTQATKNRGQQILYKTTTLWYKCFLLCLVRNVKINEINKSILKLDQFAPLCAFLLLLLLLLLLLCICIREAHCEKVAPMRASVVAWLSGAGEETREPKQQTLWSLGNHDGNAKENVTEKTSQSFKLLWDYSDSCNLSNVAELSRSWICKEGVTGQGEKQCMTMHDVARHCNVKSVRS